MALASGMKAPMGLMVDDVEEVTSIPAGDIEPTPDFGMHLDVDYLLGMAKIKGSVKILLNINRVLGADALEMAVGKLAA